MGSPPISCWRRRLSSRTAGSSTVTSADKGLFWALRGAGAGHSASSPGSRLGRFPHGDDLLSAPLAAHGGGRLLEAWQSWAPSAPDELAASLLLNVPADADRPPQPRSSDPAWARRARPTVLDELAVRAGADPTSSSIEHLHYSAAKDFSGSRLPGRAAPEGAPTTSRKPPSRSTSPSSSAASSPGGDRGAGRPLRGPTELMAGARARLHSLGRRLHPVDPDSTAFPHRRERFLLKHAVSLGAPPRRSGKTTRATGSHDRGSWCIARAPAASFPISPTLSYRLCDRLLPQPIATACPCQGEIRPREPLSLTGPRLVPVAPAPGRLLPDRDVLGPLARERLTRPAAPAFPQPRGARTSTDQKFSESGALSSSTPTDFRRSALRLLPTAYWYGLDLLASRARCEGQPRRD